MQEKSDICLQSGLEYLSLWKLPVGGSPMDGYSNRTATYDKYYYYVPYNNDFEDMSDISS
jgi:hypothetical protein